MKNVKRGETFEYVVEFDQNEWSTLYPFQQIVARVQTGNTRYNLTINASSATRTIVASADTSNWIIGSYKCDLYFVKNGRRIYIPGDDFYRFELIKSVSGEAT